MVICSVSAVRVWMLHFCQEIREAFSKKKEVLTKTSYADLVTETDSKVENMIIGFLRKKFPSHRYLAYALNCNKNLMPTILQQ